MAKAILFDNSKCTACRGCQVACKQWNDLEADDTVNTGTYENPPDLTPRTWLKMRFKEIEDDAQVAWLFTRQSCMHCTNAGCVTVCPTKAVDYDKQGFVAYDKSKCTGCGYCVEACPFNVPRLKGSRLTGQMKMEKCTFCEDRVKSDLEPACVKTCPTDALVFGELDDIIALGKARVAKLRDLGHEAAHLYGENELDGLHVVYVLTHATDDVHGLPVDPKVSPVTTLWQDIMKPIGYGVVGVVAAGLLLNYMVARARMVKSKEGK